MFTGIIEEAGKVAALNKKRSNLHITIEASFINELKIDQSIAHNGVCLTVVDIEDDHYTVTAIKETLDKTNLGYLKVGDKINLERCVKVSDRLDGHIVQGHIDQTAICESISAIGGSASGGKELNGSWLLTFEYNNSNRRGNPPWVERFFSGLVRWGSPPSGGVRGGLVTVEKGSVCVNGISLTVVESKENSFSAAIIPHTYTHTNLHTLKPGDIVNLEFDIIGKYVAKLLN